MLTLLVFQYALTLFFFIFYVSSESPRYVYLFHFKQNICVIVCVSEYFSIF